MGCISITNLVYHNGTTTRRVDEVNTERVLGYRFFLARRDMCDLPFFLRSLELVDMGIIITTQAPKRRGIPASRSVPQRFCRKTPLADSAKAIFFFLRSKTHAKCETWVKKMSDAKRVMQDPF